MRQIRVLIVDDHAVVREGMRMIMSTENTLQVVGEAKDGLDAIHQVESLQPDIILMDLVMPKGGIEAIAEIKHRFPHIKIIVLTTFEDELRIKAAMGAGADGYLLKEADGEAILKAIRVVQQGEIPLHPRVIKYLIKGITNQISTNGLDRLTEREKEVLQLIAKGLNNKTMAGALNLSEGTVKIHVKNIFNKLNVSTRTEAAILAAQMGLAHSSTSANER